MAAFANTDGGKIYFGIDDDENIVGISKKQAKDDILYINEMIDKNVHPRVKYEFNKIKISEDLYVIEMQVFKNENTPVWLTRTDDQDVIYVRRDGQSVIAHGDQIEELVLTSKKKPYDKEKTSKIYSNEKFKQLTNLYQQMHETSEVITQKQLQNIDALSIDGFVSKGLVLFSDDCNCQNCNIVCRVWPSITKGSSQIIDKKEFRGNILSILDFGRKYIEFYTKQGLIKNDGEGRTDVFAFPKRAVDEALINAVAHRDYNISGSQIDVDIFEDRMEITSPGSFLLPGNAQDYQMNRIPSRRRNEVICNILELCNLMEQSGSGFEKIIESYKNYSNEYQPKVYSDPAQFIITLFDTTSKQKKEIEINIISTFKFDSPKRGTRDYDKKILEFCLDEPRTRKEIQQYLEIADRKNFVNTVLIPLIDCELLLKTQLSNNAPNQKYRTNKEKLIYEQ